MLLVWSERFVLILHSSHKKLCDSSIMIENAWSILWMPKIGHHSYDIAVVAVRWDHTSGVSVLKVYRPWT